MVAENLLVVVQNHVGSQLGMWSRTTCVEQGLRKGSMIPFLELAAERNYAVIICNANANSVSVTQEDGCVAKVPIVGSSLPEEHVMWVYENFVSMCAARKVLLFGYGHGAMLCKEMLQRHIVNSQQGSTELSRIAAIATVEASTIMQDDDSADVKSIMATLAVNWESSACVPTGHTVDRTRATLGVSQVLSAGRPQEGDLETTAWTLSSCLDSVIRYYSCALESVDDASRGLNSSGSGSRKDVEDVGYAFACEETARSNGPPPSKLAFDDCLRMMRMPSDTPRLLRLGSTGSTASDPPYTPPRHVSINSQRVTGPVDGGCESSPSVGQEEDGGGVGGGRDAVKVKVTVMGGDGKSREGFFRRLVRKLSYASSLSSDQEKDHTDLKSVPLSQKIEVGHFDLLRVIGKGAFGKVMLVRKKVGSGAGHVFAMKVLSKPMIRQKGQVEHTMCERAILCEIRHPFICRLRFAFQNEKNLYLITDYYSGGSLFYHLRKVNAFPEARAMFYAAEIMLALDYLHSHAVVYRDLKLENVLMDGDGHVTLTDFGLSKQNVTTYDGARTFCGTAEYLAPELLKGRAYGTAVDWWSFGILLYEMLAGATPFYHKSRKIMYHCIVHVPPTFPTYFSPAAQDLLVQLLEVEPKRRLGCAGRGARDIMESFFFRSMNFSEVFQRKVQPPFKPRKQGQQDTKYGPPPTGAGGPGALQYGQHIKVKEHGLLGAKAADEDEDNDFKAFTYMGDNHLS